MNTFDQIWPWLGAAGAVILLFLLFGTALLRSNVTVSRWHDLTWLSWLCVCAYLLHNVEEYGIDGRGELHSFPHTMQTMLKTGTLPPAAFFMAVNISLFWVAGPIAAWLSKRHPIVGLSLLGVIFVNGLSHILPLFVGIGYTPGALTAALIFLPLSVWVSIACFGRGGLPWRVLFRIIVMGLLLHIILLGSTELFIKGFIGSSSLVAIQILNSVLLLLLARI